MRLMQMMAIVLAAVAGTQAALGAVPEERCGDEGAYSVTGSGLVGATVRECEVGMWRDVGAVGAEQHLIEVASAGKVVVTLTGLDGSPIPFQIQRRLGFAPAESTGSAVVTAEVITGYGLTFRVVRRGSEVELIVRGELVEMGAPEVHSKGGYRFELPTLVRLRFDQRHVLQPGGTATIYDGSAAGKSDHDGWLAKPLTATLAVPSGAGDLSIAIVAEKQALNRPVAMEVKPLDYDELRSAGLLPSAE